MLTIAGSRQANVLYYHNFDISTIHTPIDAYRYDQLLKMSKYDVQLSQYLVNRFTEGFDIGYRGPMRRQDSSNNLPFRDGVGDKINMWNKIMKEIKEKHYAGPFDVIPLIYFVQSPIGLVAKSNNLTRLIFHLSYNFREYKSVNFYMPPELCSVKYRDLDHAIENCLKS